ncbi:YggS family pyridoxal phosphate-dependent enzyme [Kocuria palustris]|uniref:YggS family pyridoxal phosphate-dependent enzyme n=1 Tax=Kocuria palustris TaxID=71999 RepID=UPI0011A6CD2C|nr:YggS family pyridoxal phosphate-dependent enzyme [Kocuria palustris]
MDETTPEPQTRSADGAQPDPHEVQRITEALAAVRERIDAAARAVDRDAEQIRLLPVSKTVPEDRLRAAVAAGCAELGENKVQEAAGKASAMADLGVRWSIIGHLQRNKAKDVAAFADEFQALDSLRLAEALDRRLQGEGRGLDVMVQVNTSGEDSKFGMPPEEVPQFLEQLPQFASLRVTGLMTIAMASEDEDRVRACFRRLRVLRDRAQQDGPGFAGDGELSMGMSEDLELGVAEGSTCVRVGRSIFGSRPAPRG